MAKFSSEAYDLSQWEERVQTSLPERGPGEEEREESREKVVELPKKELHKNKRPRRNPLKMAAATLCFGVILATVTTMIYNQVQLTELTEEINTAAQSLQEAESLEIQLNMEAAQEMNGAQVEEYATNELGMSKIQSGQVTYVGSSQEDQGDVLQEATQGSWMDQLWAWLQSLFA